LLGCGLLKETLENDISSVETLIMSHISLLVGHEFRGLHCESNRRVPNDDLFSSFTWRTCLPLGEAL